MGYPDWIIEVMNFAAEFHTVDLVLSSGAETSGVDSFALALIKAERQMRKLFTHLVYQFPCFHPSEIRGLRTALVDRNDIYLNGFVNGIDALYSKSVEDLIGADYTRLRARLDEATVYRNKIFHGQLTDRNLNLADLTGLVRDIKAWCSSLAQSSLSEFGYDGFGRDSFQKSNTPDLWKRYRFTITCLEDYRAFISQHMRRKGKRPKALPSRNDPAKCNVG